MKQHKPLLLFSIVLVCLAMMRPLLAVENSEASSGLQGTVSEELIKSNRAESSLQDVEGKHPLLVRAAQRNSVLSNEIVSISNRLKQLTQQTEQVNNQARQVEGD